jgi:class 3 adenylate cyclase
MSRVEVRDLGEPEAVVSYPLGTSNQVRLAQTVITRHVLQPGWSWEEHARPLVGTASCELYHRGVVLSGRMGIRSNEGQELVIGPNQVFDLPPGHVTWVEGDEELVMVDWAGGAGFDTRPGEEARVLATILFTDIVDSTALAREAGDASWKRTVAMHDDVARSVLAGFGGREVETAGDSFLVVFDSAEAAIRCGLALVRALDAIRLPIRVGIHSGEVVVSEQVRGLAVHAAARILNQAGSGEVLVSGTTRDLAEGATGLTFESRGWHRLKGLEREHELFAATPPAGK